MGTHNLGSSVSCTTVSLLKPNNPLNVGEHKLTINHVRRMTVSKRLRRLLFHLVVRGALPAFGRGDETTWLHSHSLTIAPWWKQWLMNVGRLRLTWAHWDHCWVKQPAWDVQQLFDGSRELHDRGVEAFTPVLRGSLWSPFSLIFPSEAL